MAKIRIENEPIRLRLNQVIDYLLENRMARNINDIAEQMDYNQSIVSQSKNGHCNVPNNLIAAICSKFPINYRWLALGEGEMIMERKQAPEQSSVTAPSTDSSVMRTIEALTMTIDRLTKDNAVLVSTNKMLSEELINLKKEMRKEAQSHVA